MQDKFECCLVDQCAPTLAGIKAGSLFHYNMAPGEDLSGLADAWDGALEKKGVRVQVLWRRPAGGLVYVYRPVLLSALLFGAETARFLADCGFARRGDPEGYIEQLKGRFGRDGAFPHEIGVFLGYPLQDVKGFIENKGRNFSLCGLWKVYGDKTQAEGLFTRYRACKNAYRALYQKGIGALHLAVAA